MDELNILLSKLNGNDYKSSGSLFRYYIGIWSEEGDFSLPLFYSIQILRF